MKIHVMVLDEVFDLGLSALLDTLGTAQELAQAMGQPRPALDVRLVGLRRRVRTQQGLSVPVHPVRLLDLPDVVLLPALGAKLPDRLQHALQRTDVRDALPVLRAWSGSGAITAAACTSTFVLASSGLLNGLRATTSWWLAPLFRELFPQVQLDESRMLVVAPGFITAGAALAHLDLGLSLVREVSPELARTTTRYLAADPHPSQAAYVIPGHLTHHDALIERFEAWVLAHLDQGFSLPEAAHAVGTSERTLARRLQAVLGKTPLAHVQDLRVERALQLLRGSDASVEQVARQVGYADAATLRGLLRRKLGRGVRELRRHA